MAFDVGAVVAHLTLDKKQWEQSIAAVKGDQKSLTGFILNNEQQIQKFGKSLTIAGGAITGMFGLLIKGAADAGDYINDLSIRTGIGTATLSAYKLAADKSGTSLEGLGTGMRGLANQMQAANDGSKESKRLFDALGVTYVDNTGKLRPLDEVMLDVADRFAGMEGGAEKTAIAVDLFGKSGTELIPMLNMGRKGLEENAEAARKLGMVWSQEAAAKAAAFNDSMVELKAGLAGTGREIATALMPTVKGLIDNVRDIAVKVREWIAEHPTLTSWIAKLTLGMGALAGLVGPMVFMLPKLAQGWHLVSIGLERANLAKTAMGALWTVALGLTAKYVTAQIDLAKAQDYAAEAGGRLHETEDKLVDRLSEAAVAAGWQFGRMSKLIEAYDGNIAALSMAIQKGKEGKDIQEALAQVSEKDAEAYDKWKKSTEGVIGAQKTLGDTLKEYGILLIGEKSKKVTELLGYERELTTLYEKGKVDATEYGKGIQKIHEELTKLGSTTKTNVLPPVREFQDLLKKAPGQFSDVTFKAFDFEDALKGVADQAMVSENTVLAFLYNTRAQFLATMGIMVPQWESFSGAAATAAQSTSNAFDDLWSDVARGFGDTFKDILSGASSFKDGIQSLWGNIKDSFFSMLGEMATKWAKSLLTDMVGVAKNAATGTASAFSSLGTTVGTIATSIATVITTVATALATAIGTIATGIATAIVALATGIAAAATILAAAAVPLMIVGAIALALYAGFSLISSLFSKGGGKSDDVTFWLKIISDNIQIIQNRLSAEYWTAMAELVAGKNRIIEQLDGIKGSLDLTRDVLNGAIDWARRDIGGWLRSIDGRFGDLKSAAGGAVSTKTELVAVHGTPSNPEYIIPTDKLGAIAAAAPASGEGKSVVVNFTQEIHFDGQFISDKDFTRGRIIPELREAFKSRAWKAEIQQALGVA